MNILLTGGSSSLIDSMLGDISTSFTGKELLALVSSVMDYKLADTHGWPFELCTGSYGSKGSLVVATDLETNVKELHEYLFGDSTYQPSDTVVSRSQEIINATGYDDPSLASTENYSTGE